MFLGMRDDSGGSRSGLVDRGHVAGLGRGDERAHVGHLLGLGIEEPGLDGNLAVRPDGERLPVMRARALRPFEPVTHGRVRDAESRRSGDLSHRMPREEVTQEGRTVRHSLSLASESPCVKHPMLAPETLALARMRGVDERERTQRVRDYVRERLKAEVEAQPRGYQAQLCREMGLTSAHMSNALSKDKIRGVGEVFARKAAKHWGLSYAELERLALGEPEPAPVSSPEPLISLDQIRALLRDEIEAERTRAGQGRPVRPRKAR